MKWSWKRFGSVAAISFLAVQILFIAVVIGLAMLDLGREFGWEEMAEGFADASYYTDLFEGAVDFLLDLTMPVAIHALVFAAGVVRWRWERRIWICLAWSVGLAFGIAAPCAMIFPPYPFDYYMITSTLVSSTGSGWIVYRYLRHAQ